MENESIRKWLILSGLIGALLVGYMAQRWLTPDDITLTFATGQRGGVYHKLAQAIATEVQQAHPHWRIELVETKGSLDNAERLQNQTAQIALLQNDTHAGAAARSLTAIHPELLHLLCHREAGIRSVPDLAGKTVALGPKGSGSDTFVREFLRFAGFEEQDLTLLNLSLKDATAQLIAGEVDALLFLTGLGNDACQGALQSGQVLLTPLAPLTSETDGSSGDSVADILTQGFRVHYPHASAHTIPLLAYTGQPTKPIGTVGVKAVLVCHRDLPDEIAESIARTIYEHRAVLSQHHSAFSHLDETASTRNLQFPLHPGAEQFFHRDDPGFLVKYAEAMGFLLSACILLYGLGSGIRKWLLQRRKDRIDKYYQAIESIIGRIREGEESIDDLELELITLRKDALSELVREKLAADESFVIYQNMANGCQQLLAQKKQERRLEQG
ncbi:TAXI family TRAP transporter solute-binding subunit [Verrucomicrobia bacterium]|nr:TAXI family TRAP transporter solute-binding subunit [Verrucomicrobiota bacterium]